MYTALYLHLIICIIHNLKSFPRYSDLSALHLNPKQRIRIFNNSRIVFQRKFRLPKYGKQWHSKHCIPWKF